MLFYPYPNITAVTGWTTGVASEAMVAESSGVRALDDAYLAMVKKWRYTPGTIRGKKISVALLLPAGLVR